MRFFLLRALLGTVLLGSCAVSLGGDSRALGLDETLLYFGAIPETVEASCFYWCRVKDAWTSQACLQQCGSSERTRAACYHFCRAEKGLHQTCVNTCEAP